MYYHDFHLGALLDYHISMLINYYPSNLRDWVRFAPTSVMEGIIHNTILWTLTIMHIVFISVALYATMITHKGRADIFLSQRCGVLLAKPIVKPLWPIFAAIAVISLLSCLQVVFLTSYWSIVLCVCAMVVIIWLLRKSQQAIIAQLLEQAHSPACGCSEAEDLVVKNLSSGTPCIMDKRSVCGTCDSDCVFAGVHEKVTTTVVEPQEFL